MSESPHIVCPHCGAINRIPASRLADTPKCGKCHEALFAGHPLELDGNSFQRHVSRNDIPLLVDFWAPWCGPYSEFQRFTVLRRVVEVLVHFLTRWR